MNDIIRADHGSTATVRPASDPHLHDTSMSAGPDQAVPAAVGLLDHTVKGAHDAIDRLAGSAAPAVRQLGETGDAWAERVRSTVRDHPLASVTAAFALGAVIARITR